MSNISVILPVLNEELLLKDAVLTTLGTLRHLNLEFQIIIVNDFSDDCSETIAQNLVQSHACVQLLSLSKTHGQAGAFLEGIKLAKMDFLIFVPADNPLTIANFSPYIDSMFANDVTVGVRSKREGYSKIANLLSYGYNKILIRWLYKVNISDVNWIQVYRREIFLDDTIQVTSKSLFWLAEILIQAKQKKMKIAQVETMMAPREVGQMTCTRPKVILSTFIEAFLYFYHFKKGELK